MYMHVFVYMYGNRYSRACLVSFVFILHYTMKLYCYNMCTFYTDKQAIERLRTGVWKRDCRTYIYCVCRYAEHISESVCGIICCSLSHREQAAAAGP